MMRKLQVVVLVFFMFLLSCTTNRQSEYVVESPDKNISVLVGLVDGMPFYSVNYKDKVVISPSMLGFSFKSAEPLDRNFSIKKVKRKYRDETWEQPWGEQRLIRDHHNELVLTLVENDGLKREMDLIFRAFDDGLGFRYAVPEQDHTDSLIIMDEITEFCLTGKNHAWWIPAYKKERYEYLFTKSNINDLDTVHTPLTIENENGLYITLHEANLENFASMALAKKADNVLECDLVPWSDGTKVKAGKSFVSPWRTIQIAENPGDLITSYISLNLNEPNALDDISWVKPSKYMGIWWGMHIGKYTFWEGEDHGASTENSKMYIDFCAKHGIPLLLIEGWNKGWTNEWYLDAMHEFSFTQSTDDFDLQEVQQYAQSKGVNLIGYHETGSNLKSYLAQIDDGMKLYHDLGIHDIKIGQVGSKLNMKEWHHGQFGVNYYRYVLKKAAEYQLAVNFHEPIKATGERRTYPHMMMSEGARGQEYNAWSEGNPPEHTVILPFTRLLSGPMDFTPGIFDVTIKERGHTRVHTTVAKQLSLYVIIYSPTQMLADLPENYEGHPAFQFLLDVPTNWETTKVINGKIGDFITIVRKDRGSNDWYLGAATDENYRSFKVALDFLDPGKKYMAEIYGDALETDYPDNPLPVEIKHKEVDNASVLEINLARGGGQAIRFRAL